MCERYAGLSEVCNDVFIDTTDYVFFDSHLYSQKQLSESLDNALSDAILRMNGDECPDLIRSVICNYIFAPCGSNGTVHVPRSLCSDECNYVRNACSNQWNIIDRILGLDPKLGRMNCSDTSSRLTPLPTCCISAGIEVKGI